MARAGYERFRGSKLHLFSRLKLKNIFPGEWESIYTGEGIEYSASKPYEAGDDLRDLDLLTLVQSGDEEIILRDVGRQRLIYLWVDVSGSMQRFPELFFSRKPEIRDIAIGLVAFSAQNAYSPVGLCAFDQEIRQFFPARSGETWCIELVTWILEEADKGRHGAADIRRAFGFLEERIPAQSLVFFVSDFQDPLFEQDFADLLRPVSKKFDFVPVLLRDPLECGGRLEHSVVVALRDCETERRTEIELNPSELAQFQQASARHLAHLEQTFQSAGLEPLVLYSPSFEDCYQTLAGFFESRKRTRG